MAVNRTARHDPYNSLTNVAQDGKLYANYKPSRAGTHRTLTSTGEMLALWMADARGTYKPVPLHLHRRSYDGRPDLRCNQSSREASGAAGIRQEDLRAAGDPSGAWRDRHQKRERQFRKPPGGFSRRPRSEEHGGIQRRRNSSRGSALSPVKQKGIWSSFAARARQHRCHPQDHVRQKDCRVGPDLRRCRGWRCRRWRGDRWYFPRGQRRHECRSRILAAQTEAEL
jgi:hypothetical protein